MITYQGQRFSDKEVIAYLRHKLETDSEWAIFGITALYNKQSKAELATRKAKGRNNAGFSAVDAWAVGLALQCICRKTLTERQLQRIQAVVPKYATQLYNSEHKDYILSSYVKEYKEVKPRLQEKGVKLPVIGREAMEGGEIKRSKQLEFNLQPTKPEVATDETTVITITITGQNVAINICPAKRN